MGLSHKARRDRIEKAISLYLRNADNIDFDFDSFAVSLGVNGERLRRELKSRELWRERWRSYADYHRPG